ncbi:MAG: ABC transporter substrate-binding protein [Alphaproteobacteria bacterium]|nr:ABC transporter substrate-binding protein [Alphaproteobacteria bacterium]
MKCLRFVAAFAVGILLYASGARAENVIRASLNTELTVLDPIVSTINATRVFAYLVFDELIGIDNEGHYHPQMLEGWQISDDRLTYTFKLRDGLKWSDGTPVTAEDCVASIKRWGKRESLGKQLMAATRDMQPVDAKTFLLELNEPFAFVIEALGKPGNTIPVMMPARIAATDPATPVKEIVGSGPFIFHQREWKPGDKAVFTPNPYYKPRSEPAEGLSGGKVVKVDRVELISIPDQAMRVAGLQTGELDLLEVVPFDFISALRNDPSVTIPEQHGVQQMMQILSINHVTPPFNDIRIRRALQAAIVQEDVVSSLGLPPNMFLKKCLSIYMCDAPGTTDAGTDVYKNAGTEHARELLKEAGYKNEPVVLLHASTSALLNSAGLVYADLMKKAGFNVDIHTSDFSTVAQKRTSRAPVEQGGWSVIPIVWNGIDLVNPLADTAISTNCNEFNPGWYCDPAQTELLKRFAVTTELAERRQLADQLQAAFHRNVNYVLGGQFSAPAAYRSDLKGVIPFGFPVFWNMERK